MGRDLARDFRLASRSLVRRPGFTSLAVVTLAIGIGGITAAAAAAWLPARRSARIDPVAALRAE